MADAPRRSASNDEPDDTSVADAATVLAEGLNLRAAKLREALEVARDRRLELDRVRRERDDAVRERDLWRQRLSGLRGRRSVRTVLGAIRFARTWRTRLRNVARGGSKRDGSSPAGDRGSRRVVASGSTDATGPAAYRASIRHRLDSSGGRHDRLRVGLIGGGAIADRLADAKGFQGWAAVDHAPGGAGDVVIVTNPAVDPRHVDRAAMTVAVVAGDIAGWTSSPWFDSFDLVLVSDEEQGAAVAQVSAKSARVVPGGADGWPAREAIEAAVRDWVSATRIAIMVQALRWDLAEPSGDYHLARALQRQFERRGHPTSIYFQREWTHPATAREDIVLHLWGRYELEVRPSQVTAIWILYHPELVTDALCRRYDVVFAASDKLAARLAEGTGLPVQSLHQATDHERFRPVEGGPRHDLLFVGNSRGTRRTILDDLTPTTHDLAVFGGGWDPERLDPRYHRAPVLPNRELPAYYAAAGIVLNDHWVEQMEAGLINNRIYDALAAGGFVISDPAPGLEEEFDGGVVTYDDPADLALTVERFLADPAARRPFVERGRRAVLARHTMDHRAEQILAALLPLVGRAGSQAPVPALVDSGPGGGRGERRGPS